MYRFKSFIKKITVFHLFKKKKNILIFSSPRSGSTWLLELVVSHSRGKSIGEPLDLRKPLVKKYLGFSNWENLNKPESIRKISKYLNDISSGKLSFKNPPPFSKFHKFIVNHSVIKILHGGEIMMNELGTNLKSQIIYLVRHPIPVSLSRKELPRLKSFIESDSFNLTSAQKLFSIGIYLNGSRIEKAVLDWCYQNTLALHCNNNDWIMITYEQLVVNPKIVLKELENRKIITKLNRINKSLSRPSKNTYKFDNESKILLENKNKDPEKIITKWVGKLNKKQINDVQKILDVFEIDLYKANSPYPKNILKD